MCICVCVCVCVCYGIFYPSFKPKGALEAQRAKYEKQLALLKEQLESAHLKESGHPSEQLEPKSQMESLQLKEKADTVQPKEKVVDPIIQAKERAQDSVHPHEQLAGPAAPSRLPMVSTPVLTAKHRPPRS